MQDLKEKRCQACETGTHPLPPAEAATLLSQLTDWQLTADEKGITRSFSFKNYGKTMAFVNAVAWIAHQEMHHPDLTVSYNRCIVNYTTHSIDGLSENDFICAAKVDALMSG